MRIVMLGSPGSGKGTQAKKIAARLGVPHISSGDIFREIVKSGTPLGAKVKALIDAGNFVPDDVTIEIIGDRLNRADCLESGGFILDGFPRTVPQAEALDGRLKTAGTPLDRVIELDVDPAILVERLGGRRHCAPCGRDYNVVFAPPKDAERCDACGGELSRRADDQPEAIQRRLVVDAEKTRPLHRYYEEQGVLLLVDGAQPVDAITAEIVERLGR
jgi:adenylate kinase